MDAKRGFATVFLAIAILTPGFAEVPLESAESGDPLLNCSVDLAFMSGYLWHGILRNDEPVFQPAITLDSHGLAFNIWGNYDFTDNYSAEAPGFTEVDYNLSYGFNVEAFSLSLGYSHYAYPNTYATKNAADNTVSRERPDDTQLVFLYLERSDLDVVPSLTVEYDLTGDDTLYTAVALDYERKVARRLTAALTVALAWANAPYYREKFNSDKYALGEAALESKLIWNPDAAFSITASLLYSYFVNDTISDAAKTCGYDAPDALVGGLKFSYGF